MIYIKGTVEFIFEGTIILENNGIGHEMFIKTNEVSNLLGEEVKLFTYVHKKDDGDVIYGFLTIDELRMFNMLLKVSGVGPKASFSILSSISAGNLLTAVLADDVNTISKAPGIGKKTAQRIVLELRDKFNAKEMQESILINRKDNLQLDSGEKTEAIEGLVALGYTQNESRKVVLDVYIENMTTEEIIKCALKRLFYKD